MDDLLVVKKGGSVPDARKRRRDSKNHGERRPCDPLYHSKRADRVFVASLVVPVTPHPASVTRSTLLSQPLHLSD